MSMKRLMSIGLLLVAVAVPLSASTFLKMSQRDLVRDSAAVVQGQVLKVSSFWDPTGKVIMTEALVQVQEKVLGNSPSVVVVRTFGGTVNGYTIEAHGFPKFRTSERVLLYLEAEKDGASRVAGYQQGQFRIVTDKAGVEFAVPAVDGADLVTPDGRFAAPVKTLRLDVLKDSIRNEARQSGRFLEN
jgi:hypothetical protein